MTGSFGSVGAQHPRHELSLDLPAVHRGVRVARHVLLRFARMQGVPTESVESLTLVVSEMLANAIDHGAGEAAMTEADLSADVRMRVTLVIREVAWCLTVEDQGGGEPNAMRALLDSAAEFDPEDDRGRGLFLMSHMVDELVVEKTEDGLGLRFSATKRYAAEA